MMAEEINYKDGTLNRLWEMMNTAKVLSPDDWALGVPNAFDWDKKPIPPEVDYQFYEEDEDEGDAEGEGDSSGGDKKT